MQIFYETLRDTFINFTKPVSQQILTTVLKELGYIDFFVGNINYKSTTTGGSETNDSNDNAKLTDNRITCEIMDSLNPRQREGLLTPEHMSNYSIPFYRLGEKAPILRDDENRIYLSSHLVPIRVELQNKITFVDYNEAANFMARLYSVYGSNLTNSVQAISFDTPIPKKVQLVLFSLYKLLDSDTNNFYKYLYDKSETSISFNSDFLEDRKKLVIRNGQTKVNVKIEFDQERSDPEVSNMVSKSYSVDIKLSAIITHSHAVFVQYSETINNMLIPNDLHPPEPILNSKNIHDHHPVRVFQEYLAIREWQSKNNWDNTVAYSKKYLDAVTEHPYTERLMIQEPWFDKWTVPSSSFVHTNEYYMPFFSSIFTIDDPMPTILDLAGSINGITLTQYSIDHILNDKAKCFNPYAEPKILINIFSNDVEVANENLSISGTEVALNAGINKNSYRIVLSKNIKEESPGMFLTVWNVDINVYRENYTDGSDMSSYYKQGGK